MTTPYSSVHNHQPNEAEQPRGGERRRSSAISIPDDDDLAASADFMPLHMFPEPHRSKDEAVVTAFRPTCTNAAGLPTNATACNPGTTTTAAEIERAQAHVQEQLKKIEAQQQELRLLQEKTQRETLMAQMLQQQQGATTYRAAVAAPAEQPPAHQHIGFNGNMMQYQQQLQHTNIPYPNTAVIQDRQGPASGSPLTNTNASAGQLQSDSGSNSGRDGDKSPGLIGNNKRSLDPEESSEASKRPKIAKIVADGIPSLLGRKVSEVVDLQNDRTDGTRKHAYTQVVGSTKYRSDEQKGAGESPQDYLNSTLRSRGYSTTTATSFDCGYPSHPTALQRSSHGVAVLRAVQKSDADALSKLLQAGLSPNPCNAMGDSVLQIVCKRSDVKLFQTFLDNGVVLEIADPFGRTPLHHAAWAPASDGTFEIVTAVLDRVGTDILRVTDKNGKTPLQYLTVDKWPRWVSYLESKRDVYFPQRESIGDISVDSQPPRCSSIRKGKTPGVDLTVVDPPNSISPEIAILVSSGKISPENSRDKATINVTPEAQATEARPRDSPPSPRA
jgi:hypothetical protein